MKGYSLLLTFLPLFGVCVSCTTTTEEKTSITANWGASPLAAPTPKPSPPKKKPSRDLSKHRTVRTTAYSHEENEPGAPGRKNAINTTLRYGSVRSAAADWSRYPLGTQFKIKGQPHLYEIDDFGSALVGTGTIDLYKPNLSLMNQWGVRHVEIEIVKWGSFERSASILSQRTSHAHCKKMYDSLKGQKDKRSTTNPDARFSFTRR